MAIRVADHIVNKIYEAGADSCFLVTGRGALFLNDALARHKEINIVPVHHEQTAGFAAVSYADKSGKPGFCMVSTGCAMTNALTAVLNAWQDGIPCIFVSGQNKLEETTNFTGKQIRTFGQQEADIIPIVESITKYAVMITDPESVDEHINEAIHQATTGRKGPVWIDVPLNVQNMRIEAEKSTYNVEPVSLPKATNSEINQVIESIEQAERPLILIGSGIRSAEAIEEFKELVEHHQLPIVFSGSAVDTIGSTHPLSIGSVGIMGCSRAGNFALQNSDLLLVIGNRLTTMTTGEQLEKFARGAKRVVVDIDEHEHQKNELRVDQFVHSDAKFFIEKLSKAGSLKPNKAWLDQVSYWKEYFDREGRIGGEDGPVDLHDLARELGHSMSDNATVVTDSGLIELVIPTNTPFKKGQRCIHPASQGSMGYALPAVIGAHYAGTEQLITVIGDDSVMMNLQELATIQFQNIPAKIFIVNNNAYAVIRKRQIQLFRNRTIGVDDQTGVGIPEFEKVAAGFDIPFRRINDLSELSEGVKEVLEMEGPVICEVMGKPDQNYIHMTHARTLEKRFVQRPLEDQSPFLDREVLKREMIIEPIDL
jgi:acetolactate synthase-1/2/3 large subunit